MIKRAKDLLLRHEGFKQFPYKDTEGVLTIGCGRNLVTRGISKDEALYLLENDIGLALDDLRTRFPWFSGLDETRRVVLVDMCVNVGIVRLLGFRKMIVALEEADYGRAADEMLNSKWAIQVGVRAKELAEMMRKGDDL